MALVVRLSRGKDLDAVSGGELGDVGGTGSGNRNSSAGSPRAATK
jgi:hypothetical protein